MSPSTEKFKLVKIPTHVDARGSLSAVELRDYVDWPAKRVYYVTWVTLDRGGHEFFLNGPDDAIVMNEMCWREFGGFSEGAVLCAISNMNYEPAAYIYDFEGFLGEQTRV